MQFNDRIRNAQEQAHELTELYGQLENRIEAFVEMQQSLSALNEQLQALQAELQQIQGEVSSLQGTLPGIARKEELDQLSKRLDAIPFEKMATKRDL